MKKKYIWGTGKFARYYSYMCEDEIEAYIDNDESKKGSVFLDKRVLHPSEIGNWDECFVILSSTYPVEIFEQLKKYGLYENIDFRIEQFMPQNMDYSFAYKQCEAFLKKMRDYSELRHNKRSRLLFWGAHYEYERIVDYAFVEQLVKNNNLDVYLVSSSHQIPFEKYRNKEYEDNIALFGLPFIFAYKTAVCMMETDYCTFQNKKERIENTYDVELYARQMDDDPAYEMIKGNNIDKIVMIILYTERMLDIINPEIMIIMDSVQPIHRIIRDVAEKKGITMIYTHAGVVPGTVAFDLGGEVGESIPSLYPEAFKQLAVDANEIEFAQKVVNYLFQSRANRKKQPDKYTVSDLINLIDSNKKTIFFAGQNDVRSYMVPYSKKTQQYYSPVFSSSVEAANYIADICNDEDWNIVYKPHPMYKKNNEREMLSDSIIYIDECDINDLIDISDLTVTILSSINYISLIRNTPVLMLGYGWLKGSGCTYEAFDASQIHDQLKKAMHYGYTKEQKESFFRHMAQCLKYYVYDDNKCRELRYGRKLPDKIEDFFYIEKLIKA